MKKYKFIATRGFLQHYQITIEAKNRQEASGKAHDLRYNFNHEWTEVGNLEPDDKLIDILRINSKGQVMFDKPIRRRLKINQ